MNRNRTTVHFQNRTRVRFAHVRAAATRVWRVVVFVAPVRGLPRWEDLPALDRLSHELADQRRAA